MADVGHAYTTFLKGVDQWIRSPGQPREVVRQHRLIQCPCCRWREGDKCRLADRCSLPVSSLCRCAQISDEIRAISCAAGSSTACPVARAPV